MKRLEEVLQSWEAVIGLEIHTELTTLETKMFCDCRINHDAEPNANVCPVCLGMPGALPVPNRRAIEHIVMAGIATNCQIQRRSYFYRKHYFYPDMSKNYQTTQGPIAFCMHGHLDLEVCGEGARERVDDGLSRAKDGSYTTTIGILRIHMEEDAAKMVHVGGTEGRIASASESLIDYNRCGTPLIELVTEPDLRSPEEARLFMAKLRRVFLALGISDCSLENGSMRCDGNVSIRRRGSDGLGTKTEMKNVNSLKSLHDALEYEICRQAEVLEGGGVVRQETRHWEPSRRRTVVMRVKETADDYRMYPDPDLAPFDLSDDFIDACRTRVPELPDAKRDRYTVEYALNRTVAARISSDTTSSWLFESAVEMEPARAAVVANVVLNLVSSVVSVSPSQVAALARLLDEESITYAQAREVLELVSDTDLDPERVVDERGMRQSTDAEALGATVEEVLGRCQDQVRQYRSGNRKVIGFLVGQCMRAARGTGNPKMFDRLLRDFLETNDGHEENARTRQQ